MSFNHLVKTSSSYYFRMRVPQDVQEHFNTPEIKRSLRTKCRSIARSHSILVAAKAEKVFCQIRTGLFTDDQIQKLITQNFPSCLPPSPARSVKPLLLHHTIDSFIKEHVLLGKWTAKTKLEVDNNLGVFKSIVGDIPISEIDRKVMVDFVDILERLPANWNKKRDYRDKSIAEILKMDTCSGNTLTPATVNKYVIRASSFLSWCVRQGFIDRNPGEGLAVAKSEKEEDERKAYTTDDIKNLIPSLEKLKDVSPERYFVPLVAMYSGLRLNEICQLHVNDIKQIEGVWCFDINDNGDKRLKNKASRRMVPVHPEFVKLGLLDHVEKMRSAGHPRLWMNLKHKRDGYGHDFSKWYQRFNRKHITQDPKKVFHSFRHLVADTLKQAGVAEGVIAEILGHANGSITTGRYGKRYRPVVLLEALKKLGYHKEE